MWAIVSKGSRMGQRRTGETNFAPPPPEDGETFQPFTLIEQDGSRAWCEVKRVSELRVETAAPPAEGLSTAAVTVRDGFRNRAPRGSAAVSSRKSAAPQPLTENVPASRGARHVTQEPASSRNRVQIRLLASTSQAA